jgi:hypothetical protein
MFYSISQDINFTLEQEQNNVLNFVELTIKNKVGFDIYRKPTASDGIISKDSCHSSEQKLAANLYSTNRLNTYDIDRAEKQREMEIIKQIVSNNKFHTSALNRIKRKNTKHTQRTNEKVGLNSHTLLNKNNA